MATEQEAKRRGAKRGTKQTAQEPSVMTPGAFEEAEARLDEIIATLEDGHVPLAEALELQAEGARLYALCSHMLDEAVLHVSRLRVAEPTSEDEPLDGHDERDAAAINGTAYFLETLELGDEE